MYDAAVTVAIHSVIIIAIQFLHADVWYIHAIIDNVVTLGDSIADDIATCFVIVITAAAATYIHSATSSLVL